MLFRKTLIIFMATLLACGPVRADISSDLTDFWNDLGGQANVTPGTAFAGQSAGYYTAGNIRARLPSRNTSIFSVSEPSFAGGCGGIDIFAGSLSFINKDELIQLSRAIAANAVGYAFDLALETISPVIAETMKDLRARLQELNLNNINSCETAQGLVDTIAGKQSLARNKLCERVGTVKGIFTDPADAKDECGTPAAFGNSYRSATEEEQATILANVNLAWDVMRSKDRIAASDWLRLDPQLAEFAMTLTGTIIFAEENADKDYYPPKLLEEDTLNRLYEGGVVDYYRCLDHVECLDIAEGRLAIADNASIRGRVSHIVDELIDDIRLNRAPDNASVAMVNGTSIPIWRALNVYAVGGSVVITSQKEPIIEIVANDIMLSWLDGLINEVIFRAEGTQLSGEPEVEQWKEALQRVKGLILEKRAKINSNYEVSVDIINRVVAIDAVLSSNLAKSAGGNINAVLKR